MIWKKKCHTDNFRNVYTWGNIDYINSEQFQALKRNWKRETVCWLRVNPPAYSKLVNSAFSATNSLQPFSLRPVACKKKKKERRKRKKRTAKPAVDWLHGGGIRVVCVVFADHCKTGPLWRRLPDCHSAGFSSLNKVGVSNRTCVDQEIPPLSRNWTDSEQYRPCSLCKWVKGAMPFANLKH